MTGTAGVYEKLGVRRVINAWGVATELGGWTLSRKVERAMDEANQASVDMQELLQKSGKFIADLLGCEMAMVTAGGAAAQALSIAACMAGTDQERISRLPDTTGMKNEVVIQKRNRYMFDRCFTLTGARLVEAGDDTGTSREDLETAVGPNTAAVAYYIQPPFDDSILSLEETVAVARARGVPAIADACSQIFPLDYFRGNAQSADLVTFGAKYMGAPHSAGFVCGKSELIDAVSAQSFVSFHYDGGRAVGRAMKIDRHEIIAVVTAVEQWFSMDHVARVNEYEARFSIIGEAVSGIDGVRTNRVETGHYVPYVMVVTVDENVVGKNARQIRQELDSGNPSIWVGADETGLQVVVNTLNDGEADIIAERLRQVLTGDPAR